MLSIVRAACLSVPGEATVWIHGGHNGNGLMKKIGFNGSREQAAAQFSRRGIIVRSSKLRLVC